MSLSTRLTLYLLAVFIILCGVVVHQSITTADHYFQQATQELSAPIAMYVADQRSPFSDGVFDAQRFHELARTAMILNPAIAVYALDSDGRILAHGAGTSALARTRVELGPLRRFIAQTGARPLLGDDPRSVAARRIFSAAAVGPRENPWGYVYVILDSGARQQMTGRAWPQHVLTIAGGSIAVILLAGFVVATLLFARLTLPLRALSRDVSRFQADVLAATNPLQHVERDEIARLRSGFDRLRARVTAQMHALRLADNSRREWIAHLSHDLRTPLTTLQVQLEATLRRDGIAATSERREGLARALLRCAQIQRLLSELFESARLEAPSLELHTECFALGELAQDAALGMRGAVEAKGNRIECDIEASDSTVRADIGLFQRLIDNLLTNAVRASPLNGVVSLSVRRSGSTVTLAVSDAGAGPTADMLDVFNKAMQPATSATGLGLHIVAQILRLHGLRSAVEETSAGGTLIRIDVPAATTEKSQLQALAR